ncbi:unnamed protein product [Microthlaspi erraticum]|uniref:Myb/SANT-like domain-containing protein n=1 Tax=Microthlaspi erraticum TaxID=1685480 RepID=A0A6D2L7A9_9BRAS|nr:unnamed protein product [Microthlaspi erraticum]
MSNYRFKDPTPVGKEFIVEKFNEEFSLNIDYKFFRKKLDHLKRKYKKYLGLIQNSTGISVDPVTFVITASDSWWKDREVCKVIKSFHRNPPEFWDIMQRCFRLYDVHSQSQYSVSQRREEMMNEGFADDEGYLNSEIYGEDTQVPKTQENEEEYRVDIDDQPRHSHEFPRESMRQNTTPINMSQNQAARVSQQGRIRHESSTHRVAGSSQVLSRNSSRGGRRKQSFQATLTDTMAGFREFQRQSLQQMRPNSFDQEDYDECEMAIKIFESMEVQKNTGFYWACIQAFKDERFWRKYFIERADKSNEDKLQFLQAVTGYTPDGEFVGKRLVSNQNYGSPNFGGLTSGNPSSGGNNSWGQTLNGQWSHGSQQWGTPPNAQQWGTPPNAQQWGPFPNAQQWGPPPNAQHWGTPTNAHQWGPPPNAQQWGTPPNAHQWGSSSSVPQWGTLQTLSNGTLHQTPHNGALHQMLNNGVHQQIFHNGVHHQITDNGNHHQKQINGFSNKCSAWIFK